MMNCQLITYTGIQPIQLVLKKCTKCEAVIKRREKFKNQLAEYLPEYGREMLNEFYKYWVELNKSQTRMRWENEKVWQLNLRLARWAKNSKFETKKNGMPDKFDPVFEATLTEEKRLKYHNYLRSIGWQYVQAPGAYGWGWKKINN